MTDTTYTVLNRHGEVQEHHLDVTAAAAVILTYDGHEFEVRPFGAGDRVDGYELWTTAFSRNSTAYRGLSKSVIFSLATDRAAAEAEIFRKVVANASWWCGQTVMHDSDYDAMIAELAQDCE